ncbi:PmoA family protein [Arenibacter sp. GZD96]|uniref:DUF6807 domain-containing protein n=1 Tax=Aurantibrevibacter litoralis TaxID=3106030 RepID=UPI002AFDCF93|nr:PmoA family protein [Arenibacter sp. GZD-96]MEA1786969.1 PmoA family protein [Arenibacter sp. GZD-96]
MYLKKIKILILIGLLQYACNPDKEDLMYISVKQNPDVRLQQAVEVNIEGLYSGDFTKEVVLVQKKEGKEVAIPFQIDTLHGKSLWFIPPHTTNSQEKTEYVLRKATQSPPATKGALTYTQEKGNVTVYRENKPVLSYRFEMNYPPDGVDSLFQKSGYIHPLWSPSGDTLTRINPPDHYHHYGIWGPWTKTKIEERSVDFWNLGEGQGTVIFDAFSNLQSGPVYAAISATQHHVDFGALPENKIALNEDLEIKVWDTANDKNQTIIDYTSTFSTPLASGILFEAYRYGGGIGIRATEKWHTDNSSVLTSEGKDRFTADGTNARWCIISGASSAPSKKSGILFMSHPNNRAHPEPMRVWPSEFYDGKSNMFFEFSPIRDSEWMIKPNNTYQLKYRMLVFDGDLSPEEAEAQWQAFATPAVVTITQP